MSLYEQISDEVTLMDAGEQKWIGEDLPLEAMVAVELLLQDMDEDKIIKVRRKNREKTSGLKQNNLSSRGQIYRNIAHL